MNRRLISVALSTAFGLGLALLVIAIMPVGPAQAATRCVQPGNPGCFLTISAALAAANPGDTIRVAAGTYIEYVTITETVILEGGWNASFTARDPAVNVTTIRPPDDSFSVVYIQGQFADHSAVAPTLDGFTITGGGGGNHGGGLRLTDSNAVVSNNVITGNVGYLLGGGVWVQRGAPFIENNHIENNRISSSGYGGGVELENTQATLINNVIAHNAISDTLGRGGGISIEAGGPVTIQGNTIFSNSAAILPGGATEIGYGGGIASQNATVFISNNLIQSNTANRAGSAGRGSGGGIYITNGPAITLTGNTVMNNTAGFIAAGSTYLWGGGVMIDSSTGLLSGNTIQGNRANRYTVFGNGGGVAVMASTLEVTGGLIFDNSTSRNCEGYGGGLYASNSFITMDAARVQDNCASNTPFYGKGGGLAFVNSPYTLTNSIIDQNYAFGNDTGVGGIYAGANSLGLVVNNTIADNNGQGIQIGSPITLTNSIIMGHTTGISLTAAVAVNATYNNFYDNITHQRGFALHVSNIVINPQLDANYQLTASSPGIDMGTRTNAPYQDFTDEVRPMTGTSGLFRFDIGADEFTGTPQVNRNLSTQPADFTLIGPGNPQDNPVSTGSNDWIGYAALGGDFNGDNRADLIAGAPNLSGDFDGGVNDDGRIFALYNTGSRRLGVVDLYTTTADLEVRSWVHQQHIGRTFAASDLNGDGLRDLIIGSVGGDNNGQPITGTVYVFAGGSGLAGTRTLSPSLQATYRFLSSESTQSFAEANSLAAGQLNNTGPEDLVVGEVNGSGPGNRLAAGVLRVFFGSNSLPATWDARLLPASLTIYGPAANTELGQATLADFNGDARLDLIARTLDTVYVFYAPLSSGVIDLASAGASLSIGGFSAGRLAAGDVNGDHIAEILVGDGNRLKIISGNSTSTLLTITNVTPSALHTVDWNGDGNSDILIGEHSRNRSVLVFGRSAWIASADATELADWLIIGEKTADLFGYSLSSGDLDADGGQDLILGSRSHSLNNRPDPNFNDAGAIYVFYGQPGTPPSLSVFLPVLVR